MEKIFALPPVPTAVSRPFWDGCNEGKLLLQSCENCAHVFYYPRQNCPRCGSDALVWQPARGKGTVWSFTHVAVSFYGPQWESQLPYTPFLVDLDEGVRMLSRLIGPNRGAVRIGDRVWVEFVAVEKQKLPYFRLLAT